VVGAKGALAVSECLLVERERVLQSSGDQVDAREVVAGPQDLRVVDAKDASWATSIS
jgi:hypothetical protein